MGSKIKVEKTYDNQESNISNSDPVSYTLRFAF